MMTYIYGRGACDAKGIIAAQIASAEQLHAQAGAKVGLLFVVGEERDSAGAKLANLSPKGSRFLINGEPTDNRLALASKGALRVSIKAERQDGALGLSRTRRKRSEQAGGSAEQACLKWNCRWSKTLAQAR